MKILYVIFFGILLIGCNQRNNNADNNNENNSMSVSELSNNFVSGWNNKDSAAIINSFDVNGVVMNDSSVMKGTKEIAANWVSGGVKVVSDVQITSLKSGKSNSLAFDAGTYTSKINLPDKKLNEKGNYSIIWEKINNEWKIISAHIEDVTQMPDVVTIKK